MDGISKAKLAEMANAARSLMDGTTGPVKKIIAENDLVFGVWPDDSDSEGIGTWIIKGHRRLKAIASGGNPAPAGTVRFGESGAQLKIAAIPCDNLEQAVAAQRTLGEPEPKAD